jgi:hypothetical protein
MMGTPSTSGSLPEPESSGDRPSFLPRSGAGAFFISIVLPGGGGGGGNEGSKAHQIETRKRQLSTNSAQSKKLIAMGAAAFSLPNAPEMSDPGLPVMAGLENSAGSVGGAGGGSGGDIGTGTGKGPGPGS